MDRHKTPALQETVNMENAPVRVSVRVAETPNHAVRGCLLPAWFYSAFRAAAVRGPIIPAPSAVRDEINFLSN